ncbi:MAG: tetratricopeptide repeat protein, partial [Myxococcales bacterium]|nr:tetratricopeptide repeat protein [Myxococcales bacterium]
GLASAPSGGGEPPCRHTDRPLLEIWTEARAEALREQAPAVADELERWADEWRDAARRSCEEVHVEQTRPESSLGPRRACLDAQLDGLAVVLAPPAAIEVARRSGQLEAPRVCLGEAVLDHGDGRPPADQRETVSRLRRALLETYWGTPGLALAERRQQAAALRRESEGLGYPPLSVLAALTQGTLAMLASDVREARRGYGEALDLGQGHDPRLAIAAWSGLAKVALDLDLDAERSAWLLDRVDHGLRDLPEALVLRAQAAYDRGRLELLRGEPARAEALVREAAGLLIDEPQAQWRRAVMLRQLAAIVDLRGRPQQAEALRSEARAIDERLSARDDPRVDVGFAALEQGLALMDAGELDAARVELLRALERIGEENGEHGLEVANAHVALVALYDARGELEPAWRHAVAADRLVRETAGPDHPDRIGALSAMGTVAFRKGRFEEAAAAYERALTLAEARLPAGSPDLAWARANLAEALHERGQDQRAETMLWQAIESLERALGAEHPDLAIPSKALGAVLRARGDLPGARAALERALERFGDSPEHRVERAQTRWELARVLDGQGEGAAALEQASRARDELAALGPDLAPRRAELDAWIAARSDDGPG